MSRRLIASLLAVGIWALGFGIFPSAQQMPDPSQIHGRSFPEPSLKDGTVTVRVTRESIGNWAPGQRVRVTVGGTTKTATTDQEGRAEFAGLPAGEALAEAVVDGETLKSQPFPVPTSGGLRVILVAGLAKAAERKKQEEAAALAAPPIKGVVSLGSDSRIVMEFNNDTLWVNYVLEIVNSARTRVDIGGPLQIELPAEAAGAHFLEGSTPAASVDGTHVTVTGPFAPGATQLLVQFSLRYGSATHAITQPFPVPLQRTIVAIEKVGSLAMSSPQFASVGEVPAENGVYLLGEGGALQPGTPLTFTLTNLPVHSSTARYVALGIALLITGVGVWLSMSPSGQAPVDRKALTSRRDALLAELAHLEAKRRDGAVLPEKTERRRQRVLNELERIYSELDATIGPRGGGEGIAA